MAKKLGTPSSRSPSRSPRSYRRLGRRQEEEEEHSYNSASVPRGFVPIMVGTEARSAERVLVRVNKFKDPHVAGLLQMAEDELGCQPQGVLRLTCDADYFRRIIGA